MPVHIKKMLLILIFTAAVSGWAQKSSSSPFEADHELDGVDVMAVHTEVDSQSMWFSLHADTGQIQSIGAYTSTLKGAIGLAWELSGEQEQP